MEIIQSDVLSSAEELFIDEQKVNFVGVPYLQKEHIKN